MLKAVIFDVDGVLVDSFSTNLKFYQDLLKYSGYPPPTEKEFYSFQHLTITELIKKIIGSESKKEISRIVKLVSDNKVRYHFELLKTSDGLEETIINLSNHYVLAIVTSRLDFTKGLKKIPLLLKLNKYFKVIISYEDTEKHKPDPEPLLLATKKLKINPDEAVYIGDSESDILASSAAGMHFIGLVTNITPAKVYKKYKVKYVAKLPKIVKYLNKY